MQGRFENRIMAMKMRGRERAMLLLALMVTCSGLVVMLRVMMMSDLSKDFPGESTTSSSNKKGGGGGRGRRLFHTAVTSSDSVYNTWQCRVMYYWFKKHRKREMGMGGFTRILHSTHPDAFMHEIPTFLASTLPDSLTMGYVVLNRPWAFVQWLHQAQIQEDYILMCEPDHLIVKPIPNLSKHATHGAAFPFFYIQPENFETQLRKFFPQEMGPITKIDPIGNSPVIVGKDALKKIAPTWMSVSMAMKKDPEADKAFGWVLEMYAYAVASALHGVRNVLRKDFMIQPPWDTEIGDAYIIHYTYGCDYDLKGKLSYGKIGEWRFDKRLYERRWPPRNLSMPPPGVPDSVVTLVKMVNEATANLPNWGEDW